MSKPMSKKEQPQALLQNARQQSAARFDAFDDSVMAAARRQADAIVAEGKKQAEEAYEKLVAQQRTDPVVLYRAEARAKLERKLASAKQQNRKKQLVYSGQQVNALCAEVEEKLQNYVGTPAYAQDQAARMAELVSACGAGQTHVRAVYVRRGEVQAVRDAAQKAFPGCEVRDAADIRLGGFRVEAGHVLYDLTLDHSDQALREAFLSRCGLQVE